jgi:alpha-tubulin suppressor-like RCC1 family protein
VVWGEDYIWGAFADGPGYTVSHDSAHTVPMNPATFAHVNGNKAVVITATGELFFWGVLGQRQDPLRPQGPLLYAPTPVQVTLPEPARSVSSAGQVCAVLTDGSVHCWGDNAHGQVGDGTQVPRAVPVRVSVPEPIVEVQAAMSYTLALGESGTLWGWGFNGKLSLLGKSDDVEHALLPVRIDIPEPVVAVSACGEAACAVAASGAAYCWGAIDGLVNLWPEQIVGAVAPSRVPGISGAVDLALVKQNLCFLLEGDEIVCGGFGDDAFGSNSVPYRPGFFPIDRRYLDAEAAP